MSCVFRFRAPCTAVALAILVAAVCARPTHADPLQDAAIAGNAELVRVLLAAGARADLADRSGLTPLHYAAALGKTETVAALLKAGANPNVRDVQGVTPLHLAAADGYLPVVEALLAAGADPNSGLPADGQAISAAQDRVMLAVDVFVEADGRPGGHPRHPRSGLLRPR